MAIVEHRMTWSHVFARQPNELHGTLLHPDFPHPISDPRPGVVEIRMDNNGARH
jgi:hypothetical protein